VGHALSLSAKKQNSYSRQRRLDRQTEMLRDGEGLWSGSGRHAASLISSNLKGSIKQFGWLQSPASKFSLLSKTS